MKKVRKANHTATSDQPNAPIGKELTDADLEKATGGYWDSYGGGYDDWGYSGGWGGGMAATYFVGGGCDAW